MKAFNKFKDLGQNSKERKQKELDSAKQVREESEFETDEEEEKKESPKSE